MVNEVGLGHRDHTAGNAEQVKDGEVFIGLWLPAFVGGDNQKGDVDADRPGKHVLQQSFVSRNVHERHFDLVSEGCPGETEVNCHPSPLLLDQTVWVATRQGLD